MKCPFPIKLRSQGIEVPCGRCAVCLSNRQQDWITRLTAEMDNSESSFFVTLTYDDDHLKPFGSSDDIKLFHKKLRGRFHQGFFVYDFCGKDLRLDLPKGCKFKFYLVMEYGPQNLRPHYHCLYFLDKVIDLYTFDLLIHHLWDIGFSRIDLCNGNRINYTTKYLIDNKVQPFVPRDYEKPFSMMSKGLGKCLLTDNMKDWWRVDPKNRLYVPQSKDHKMRLPRYFKDKLFDDDMKADIKDKYSKIKDYETPEEFRKRIASYYEYERQVRRNLERKKILKNV